MKPDAALTDRAFWDRRHQGSRPAAAGVSRRRRFLLWLNRGFDSHYHFLTTHILGQYLPRGGRIIELGCAPGRTLLDLCARFGMTPFGIDSSDVGYQATLDEFQRKGVDPRGIIHGDFADPAFRRRYRESFDVVYSGGLIEHFTDPAAVVAYHVELLKPGGRLVVSVPNLRAALYYPVASLTQPEVLAAHNLDVMRLPAFRAVFANEPLRTDFCDYLGFLNVAFMFRPGNRLIYYLQLAIDTTMIRVAGRRDLRNRHTSPYLLYVGTKDTPSR